ncbi:MAG: nucleotidyltransferase family protein, partial [Prevotella sp.]
MRQAMIFAAGLGTRLRPMTDTMPKALVKVGGEPLLWHVVTKLKAAGFERIVVNVHHFAQQIIDYLASNDNFGLDIRVSDETEMLLETGGGIKKAAPLFDPNAPILIHNVDILSNVDLADLYEKAKDNDATLLVSQRETSRYLVFRDDMQLTGWINIKTGETKPSSLPVGEVGCALKFPHWGVGGLLFYAFSGIHVFSPRLFPLMAEWREKFGIIDFYLKACESASVRGVVKDDLSLLDVGKLDSLDKAE